ncbi:hypothetical protein M378DRAFT_154888 [Amanita muscaria Koide BX008]|uniref:Uncharacterized protein n=1 Tax=Amanita muscaria (strain Koide BX008) TaxID=946122 RepID=A0A0C2T5U2_AMAMK|nr:hypothetical protein M378DRAFT_154888 [Amanita muscaria Koide BX008]
MIHHLPSSWCQTAVEKHIQQASPGYSALHLAWEQRQNWLLLVLPDLATLLYKPGNCASAAAQTNPMHAQEYSLWRTMENFTSHTRLVNDLFQCQTPTRPFPFVVAGTNNPFPRITDVHRSYLIFWPLLQKSDRLTHAPSGQ